MDGKRRAGGIEGKKRASISPATKRGVWDDQEAVPKRAKLIPQSTAGRAKKKLPAPAPAPAKRRGAFADEESSDESSVEQRQPKKKLQDTLRREAFDSPWGAIDRRSEAADRRKDIERRKQAAAAANAGVFQAIATKQAEARRRASPPRPAIPKKKKQEHSPE